MEIRDQHVAPISGTVTHPHDLGPAIAALSDRGRAYLNELAAGRAPTGNDIARAADWERETVQ